MGLFDLKYFSGGELKQDMDVPDLENQLSDVKPRPIATSNYWTPTGLVLFGLFVLVLIPGIIYYRDQSSRFATTIDARDAQILKLEEFVKSLRGEIAARDSKINVLEGNAEDLKGRMVNFTSKLKSRDAKIAELGWNAIELFTIDRAFR
eukprot:855651_1